MKNKTYLFFCLAVLLLNGCGTSHPIDESKRPESWAQKVTAPPLYNLFRVSNDLYRSEQPSKEGMKTLEKIGIKTVLNVRNFSTDKSEGKETNLILKKRRINTWTINYQEVVDALKIIRTSQKPILLHCKHGSDRTGCVTAAYRIAFMNWSKEEAISEFKLGGFGYHDDAFPNILKLLENINPHQLKEDVFGNKQN